MHLAEIRIENFRLFGTGDSILVLPFRAGLNVLVGENDSGKTAIVDAIRFALGTTSQDFQRFSDEDFHVCQVARTTDAGEASVRVPAGSGGRFVLVRDLKWVKPMTFHVNVAR